MTRINGWACVFLVALRLVIGWHFMIEGAHKIETHWTGKTSTNIPWTGEGFFREAYGPAAPHFREALQLDDRFTIARLKAKGDQVPPALAEWNEYLKRFASHYELTEEQKKAAEEKLNQSQTETLTWLGGGLATDVKKLMAWGPVELKMTVPQRITEAENKLQEIDDVLSKRLPAFNKDVEKTRLRSLKADAAKLIADLSSEFDARTTAMRSGLASVLTAAQKSKGPVPEARATTRIVWLDRITMYAQAALGVCLLLGLFSRLACFLLFGFLMQITFLAPALPFAPSPPGALGYYLYVNLYTIEMVALLALMCMPTGRWFGIDALIYAFTRRRKVVPAPPPAAPRKRPAPSAPVVQRSLT